MKHISVSTERNFSGDRFIGVIWLARHHHLFSRDIKPVIIDVSDGLVEFIRRAMIKGPTKRIASWRELQDLLASGKGHEIDLLANTGMDMTVVLKLKTAGIDTSLLVKELHQVLKLHHASYDLEVVDRDSDELDFTL